MKSFAAATLLLGLTTLSSAARTQRRQTQPGCIVDTVNNPDQDQTKASIDQWNADVNAVNSFLNSAAHGISDPTDLASQAQAALANAQDEPCQLMTLASVFTADGGDGTEASDCAVSDLMNVFQTHVLDNLNTIISNPSDTTGVQNAVLDINNFRCCNVLGDASILWKDAAEVSGIGDEVTIVAPYPDACSGIVCTNHCGTLDDGEFGTPGDLTSGQ